MTYPYTDNLMRYDEVMHRYVLTEDGLKAAGVNLRTKLERRRGVDASLVINGILETASDIVYNYIHEFNSDNLRQDMILASCPSFRPYIQKALQRQALHLLRYGDLTGSPDREIRANAVDGIAKQVLNTTIPELGCPITYAGGY